MHSTFSDGRDPIEGNVAEAEALGLTAADLRRPRARRHRLGARVRRRRAADPGGHGRRAALRDRGEAARHRPARSTCPTASTGVDAIYAADHQVPLADGPDAPARGAERLESRRAGGRRRCWRRSSSSTAAGARPARARRDRPLPQHPPEARPGRGRRPARSCSTSLAAETARDRPADRDLRALALPVGAHARAVPRAAACRSCSARTATRATTIGRYDHCLDGPARARRATWPDVGVLERDPLGVRGRRRRCRWSPAATSSRSPACTASATRDRGPPASPPRVAVVVPAWNEAAVIGRTIDTLLRARVPARAPARLRRRRREHRRDAGDRRREGRRVPGPRRSTCAASDGRRGQGAHAQPRAAPDPRRGLVRGGADHRRRRDLHRRARCGGWSGTSPTPTSARSPPTSRRAAGRPTT